MFGIFKKNETLINPPPEAIEELEIDDTVEEEEDHAVSLIERLELETKIQERLAVFDKKIKDISKNYRDAADKAKGLRVCVSPDTLQYIICDMEAQYPTHLIAAYQEARNPKMYQSLEGQLANIENGIMWCDSHTQYDITIHMVYASFWHLGEALEHLEYAKANKEKLGQIWE